MDRPGPTESGVFDGLHAVTLHAPIPVQGKLLGIGLNYTDHAKEAAELMEQSKEQLRFAMPGTAVNDPFAPIQWPRVSSALD
jgi:2-keto-4-pentenoate hydratase/2-oxohepta-3-ene-1,7-dioic acid hydratase in catechol pathway